MKDKDIDFLKTLIIKLDISIEAERNNVSADGLMLIFDFTEKNRKESITKALDILNKTQNKWQKLKEWLEESISSMSDSANYRQKEQLKFVIQKMQELEVEDEKDRVCVGYSKR